MIMMMRIAGFALLTVLTVACRSTRKIGAALARKDTTQTVVTTPSQRDDSTVFIRGAQERLAQRKIDYNTFTAKVNVDYRDASNKSHNVNATIRMQKDSAIWISANALLGIEALRALITRDSVKILDKLNKVYSVRSMAYLQEVTDMPLDLSIMQNLIVGNPVFVDSVIAYGRNQGTLTLLSVGTLFRNLLTINEDNMTLRHSKVDDLDPALNRTADFSYADYDDRKGVLFATRRQLYLSESKKLDVKLDFRQYDFNVPVSFPFSIPKNYKPN